VTRFNEDGRVCLYRSNHRFPFAVSPLRDLLHAPVYTIAGKAMSISAFFDDRGLRTVAVAGSSIVVVSTFEILVILKYSSYGHTVVLALFIV
jgi:hypothetical protein